MLTNLDPLRQNFLDPGMTTMSFSLDRTLLNQYLLKLSNTSKRNQCYQIFANPCGVEDHKSTKIKLFQCL